MVFQEAKEAHNSILNKAFATQEIQALSAVFLSRAVEFW